MSNSQRTLRARATLASAALAFNPHQRRDSRGRWVKLADHERKPRAPRAGRKSATPSAASEYASRVAALTARTETGVQSQEKLGEGRMGDVRMATLKDGTRAVYKRAKGRLLLPGGGYWNKADQVDSEELGGLLAAALGVQAPAIQRLSEDELYMEVAPGQTGYDKYPGAKVGQVDIPRAVLTSDHAARVGLLDVLTNNPDRHGANWLLDEQDGIHAIDHGLLFRQDWKRGDTSDAAGSPFAAQHFVTPAGEYSSFNPLSAGDVDRVRDALEAVRPRFTELGRDDWLDGALTRLEALRPHATAAKGIY